MSDISFDEGTTSIDKDVNVGENVIVLAEIDAEETVMIVQEVKAADKIKVLAEIELDWSDSEVEEGHILSKTSNPNYKMEKMLHFLSIN